MWCIIYVNYTYTCLLGTIIVSNDIPASTPSIYFQPEWGQVQKKAQRCLNKNVWWKHLQPYPLHLFNLLILVDNETVPSLLYVILCNCKTGYGLRESHAVILRDRVVPASPVPFPGEPSGEPGNGTWRAGTTLYRRNDSVGFFFSPVTIKLLQRIRTKTSFDQFCVRFIRIYRLLWSSARVRNELLTNHRRDIKTQGEGRWTRQGWIYPMFDVIRHIFTIPLQNQRNSKGEKYTTHAP